MERIQMTAEVREGTGKKAARDLRQQGLVPAVLYGRECSSLSLKVDNKRLQRSLGRNAIIDLTLEGDVEGEEQRTVMIKEVQRDVIKGSILHADFHQISLDERINTSVQISLEGTPEGVREGGVLQQLLREIEIECLPTDIPDSILAEIDHLDINDSMTVGELEKPEEVDFITSLDEVVVNVVLPTEEVEEEIEEEEILEPEVIGEEPVLDEEEAEELPEEDRETPEEEE